VCFLVAKEESRGRGRKKRERGKGEGSSGKGAVNHVPLVPYIPGPKKDKNHQKTGKRKKKKREAVRITDESCITTIIPIKSHTRCNFEKRRRGI